MALPQYHQQSPANCWQNHDDGFCQCAAGVHPPSHTQTWNACRLAHEQVLLRWLLFQTSESFISQWSWSKDQQPAKRPILGEKGCKLKTQVGRKWQRRKEAATFCFFNGCRGYSELENVAHISEVQPPPLTPPCLAWKQPGARYKAGTTDCLMHLSCVNTISSAAAADHWRGRKNQHKHQQGGQKCKLQWGWGGGRIRKLVAAWFVFSQYYTCLCFCVITIIIIIIK